MLLDDLKLEINVSREAIASSLSLLSSLSRSPYKKWKISKSLEHELVTDIDIEINKLIIDKISSFFPGDKIIGEELVFEPRESNSKRLWLIDPIDGTRSFVKNICGYSIMISFIYEGEPQFGIISDVGNNATYISIHGEGIHILDRDQLIKFIAPDFFSKKLIWNPFSSHPLKHMRLKQHLLNQLGAQDTFEIESLGLRAVNLAKGNGFFILSLPNSAKVWDTAAACIMVTELGGHYTDLNGRALDYSCDELVHATGVIATIDYDHNQALKIVNRCINMTHYR